MRRKRTGGFLVLIFRGNVHFPLTHAAERRASDAPPIAALTFHNICAQHPVDDITHGKTRRQRALCKLRRYERRLRIECDNGFDARAAARGAGD